MIEEDAMQKLNQIIADAAHILVIQADNPDGDSLGTALACEDLLEEMGKKVSLYCGADMPSYLHYVDGWDRVSKEVPHNFDASIIVDASTKTLLDSIEKNQQMGWLAAKPCVVLDHHTSVINGIDFADVSIIDPSYASTGDILLQIADHLKWKITPNAAELMMISILGDTQGLTNELASSDTYRTMAALIDAGANRTLLEEKRRKSGKMPRSILIYKAALIQRADFTDDGTIASVIIPPKEIKSHSPLYNPAPLIQTDLLQTEGVLMAIVFKYYDDGRITGSIRANSPMNVADVLAESFGGGGHPYASGFKDTSGKNIEEIKKQCIAKAQELARAQEEPS